MQPSIFERLSYFLIIYLDVTDDDLDKYEESQDPQPIRLRRLRFRRVARIRIRLRRLKCPLRCASYYACLAKTSGLGKLACLALKKKCHCWEECSSNWNFSSCVYVVFNQFKYEFENRLCVLLFTKAIKIPTFINLTLWKVLSFILNPKNFVKRHLNPC